MFIERTWWLIRFFGTNQKIDLSLDFVCSQAADSEYCEVIKIASSFERICGLLQKPTLMIMFTPLIMGNKVHSTQSNSSIKVQLLINPLSRALSTKMVK